MGYHYLAKMLQSLLSNPYRVLAGVPVIENSVVLVAPQANEFVWVSEVCGGDLLYSVNHFGEVPQVEHVVTLGRRG